MEKKAQLAFHKQVILTGATFEGLITLKGVLMIHYCFCFTLRTMFNSNLGGGGGGGGGGWCVISRIHKFFSKIQLLYLLTYFSCCFICLGCLDVFFFLLLFYVSYELGWCLVMVLRMLWYYASNCFS